MADEVKFCGCCSLQRGAIIWGYLNLMIDVASFIASVVFLTKTEHGFVTIVLSVNIFTATIDAMASIYLIIGALQKRADFILLWLVFYFVEIVYGVVVIYTVFPVLLLLFGPLVYAWLCNFAFYKSLSNQQNVNNTSDNNETVSECVDV